MINRRQLLAAAGVTALAGIPSADARRKDGVFGRVFTVGDVPVAGARVTLYSPDFMMFRETRTNKKGRYSFLRVDSGNHQLAVSARGYQHRIVIVSVTGGVRNEDFGLVSETDGGNWTVAGALDPALTGGPLSGTLLPDGRVFFTSDAVNSQLFDPVSGITTATVPAASPQSGHAASLLADGRILLVGGGELLEDATIVPSAAVRAYRPNEGAWEEWPGLLEPRWRPALTRLPDGRLLVSGGVGAGGALLATCEALDPLSGQSSAVGSLTSATSVTPAVPLANGKALAAWGAPALFDPASGVWSAAAAFKQPLRANVEVTPDHRPPPPGEAPRPGDLPDHQLLPLPNGGAVAVGIRRTAGPSEPAMAEYYDPRRNTWTQGGSPFTIRSQPLALPLPDGRILAAGGRQEDADTAQELDEWSIVPRADLLDTDRGAWRRVDDMPVARSGRGVTLLLPDGRVLVAGGSGDPALNAPTGGADAIHLYSPPYLNRGTRPVIESLSATTLHRGASFTMKLRFGQLLTDVVLIGARACAGYADGGPQRFVRLRFSVRKGTVKAVVPKRTDPLPPGHYLLFALVDDVPSEGRIVLLA